MINDPIQQSERQLIKNCMAGNEKYFRLLIEKYQDYVYMIAIKVLCNEEDAKDTVQETFIRIWKNLKRFDHNKVFTTWMYKIAVNICYDKLRSRKRQNGLFVEKEENTLNQIAEITTSDTDFENKNLSEKINQLVKQLTPKQRMVFILRDIQELSVEEVGKILRISKGSVKTNLYYARIFLKEKLKNE